MADLLRLFTLTVTDPNAEPVAGARVRLLSPSGVDVTATLFGSAEVYTDETGLLSRLFLLSAALTPGVYTIQVLKSGFDSFTLTTSALFIGAGSFTASLSPSTLATGSYEVTPPVGGYFSAFYPILSSVAVPDSEEPWELIRYHITHMDGRTSILEAPVDAGLATADLHSRVRLKATPNFVPDGQVSLIDPDFSDYLSVTLESLTATGARSIPDGDFSFHAANMAPAEDINTLVRYTSATPVDWITLLKEPVVFRGFYFDTMVYLNGDLNDEGYPPLYTLHVENLNSTLERVGTVATSPLSGSHKAQRIRIDAQPDEAVKHARLWVTDEDDTTITKILTIHYRG